MPVPKVSLSPPQYLWFLILVSYSRGLLSHHSNTLVLGSGSWSDSRRILALTTPMNWFLVLVLVPVLEGFLLSSSQHIGSWFQFWFWFQSSVNQEPKSIGVEKEKHSRTETRIGTKNQSIGVGRKKPVEPEQALEPRSKSFEVGREKPSGSGIRT